MTGSINCIYETPCKWCTKWDKKCDRKIGCQNSKSQNSSNEINPMEAVVTSFPVKDL